MYMYIHVPYHSMVKSCLKYDQQYERTVNIGNNQKLPIGIFFIIIILYYNNIIIKFFWQINYAIKLDALYK